ncbi:hypothetical protein HDU84_004738 [Entophlyctis sp. JEL0112]|nr:hypothetical protein HDU84_004738 [Entophlyctis sp. JEL0112]
MDSLGQSRYPAAVHLVGAMPALLAAAAAVAVPRLLTTSGGVGTIRQPSSASFIAAPYLAPPAAAFVAIDAAALPVPLSSLVGANADAVDVNFSFGFFEVCAGFGTAPRNLSEVVDAAMAVGVDFDVRVVAAVLSSSGSGVACIHVEEYCTQMRINSVSCSHIQSIRTVAVVFFLFHIISLWAMWTGVIMMTSYSHSYSVANSKPQWAIFRLLLPIRAQETFRKNKKGIGVVVTLFSLVFQFLFELLGASALAITIDAYKQDPIASTRAAYYPSTPKLLYSSSTLLIVLSLTLNILMTVTTFARYNYLIFSIIRGKVRSSTPASYLHGENGGRRASSTEDLCTSVDADAEDVIDVADNLYDLKFKEWARDVAAYTLSNVTVSIPINARGAGTGLQTHLSETSTTTATASINNGGGAANFGGGGGGNGCEASRTVTTLTTAPNIIHDTRSNHSNDIANNIADAAQLGFDPVALRSRSRKSMKSVGSFQSLPPTPTTFIEMRPIGTSARGPSVGFSDQRKPPSVFGTVVFDD